MVDAVLSWYVPFFAMIYIARDKNDIVFLLKIICVCALFNTGAGVVEFFLKHRFFVEIFPKGMLATMIENNPTLVNLLPNPQDFRNGLFRASSTFVTPLAFGEFQIIVIPIGLFFLLHLETLFDGPSGGPLPSAGDRWNFLLRVARRVRRRLRIRGRVCHFLFNSQSGEQSRRVWSQQLLVCSAWWASAVSLE